MTRPRKPTKRPYLAKEDRRTALLDAAAALVEEHGWNALTMISLAEGAQVSRQLVYQHFASIDELMADTMAYLLRDAYERVRHEIKSRGDNLDELMSAAERLTFDLPPARARALWQMMVAHNSADGATARMSRRLRHLLTNLWTPVLVRTFRVDERRARSLAWMLIMSFWGAMQLVDDGELTRQQAMELSGWMVDRLRADAAPAPRARRRA